MKVSIIVPVYNVENYLDVCIKSIINQTHKDIEIILIDDGSKDNSGIICDEWKKKDNRITVVHQENAGLSEARNAGLRTASGKYVLFVDSDDYLEYNAVEIMMKKCKEENLDVLKARHIIHYADGDIGNSMCQNYENHGVRSGIEFFMEAYRSNTYSAEACDCMYSREFIIQNDLFFKKGIYHEDEHWTPQVLLKAERVNSIDFLFYHYIMRQGSITNSSSRQKHGVDLINTAFELSRINSVPKFAKTVWNDLVAGLYYYGIRCGDWKIYKKEGLLSKRFAIKHGLTKKNTIRTLLFVLSYRLYVFVDKLYRSR